MKLEILKLISKIKSDYKIIIQKQIEQLRCEGCIPRNQKSSKTE